MAPALKKSTTAPLLFSQFIKTLVGVHSGFDILEVAGATFLDQGCQIGHFMANFEKFGHFLTALDMKKCIWPCCKIRPFFCHFFGLSL